MFNLIEVQDAIKGLPIQDIMKYARGTNPDVPAYLALAELNRRKQLQDTAMSFYGEPQTVREQIESSLTGAPQGQVNPTAPPPTANPTVPPQLQTLVPPPARPTQAPAPMGMLTQGNLTQAPPPPQMPPTQQMARGGLASLPMKMFKRANYAGGGIVAFQEGGDTMSGFETEISPQALAMDELRRREAEKRSYDYMLGYKKPEAEPVSETKPESKSSESATPNRQASATSSGQISTRAPAEPMFGKKVTVTQPPLPELTDEQLFERRRKLQELAGVSKDPYAGVRERYAAIEAKRAADEAEDPKNALRAMLRGYAQAKATDPFGVQLAAGSEKMAAFDEKMAALRDKQATSMAELQLNMAKEEDARRRGDVTAVESARAAQEKAKMDLAKLEIDRMNAQTARIGATRPAAEIQTIERVMKDKNMTFTEAMEYLQGVKGLNALRTAADKEWNESLSLRMEWEKKGGYPAYMASKGLSVAGQQQQKVVPPAVGTVQDGYRFKGGDPSKQQNWEKV